MELSQAIREYMTAHRVNNDSADTLKNYRYVLPRFAKWLESQGVTDTDALRLNHLRGWVVYLQELTTKHGDRKLKDTTVQMYSKHILDFCHWLEQEEIIEKPITTRFKLPRIEKQFIPTLVPDKLTHFLEGSDPSHYHAADRDHLITPLCCHTQQCKRASQAVEWNKLITFFPT